MRISDSDPFRLQVLGAPDLRRPDGRRVASVLSQPKRLGLLTYLALADAPVSRATLVALFWPESDEGRARNALSQAVFHLRRSLDERVVQSVEGDRLWAPREHLWCDARDVLAGDDSSSSAGDEVDEHPPRGELLEGWNAVDSQELQEWLDALRRSLRGRHVPVRHLEGPGVAGGAARPAHEPVGAPEPGPAPRGFRGARARVVGLAFVGVLVALAALVMATRDGDPTSGDVGSAPASVVAEPRRDLAVLMPRVTSTPGAPSLGEATLHGELLAHLPHVEGLRIVAAAYAGSVQDLRRQLAAVGVPTDDEPRWILEVSVRLSHEGARVVGLLYGSPTLDLVGRVSFDAGYGGPDAALIRLPQEIARRVADMVQEALAEGR